jgi:hypothetical protein
LQVQRSAPAPSSQRPWRGQSAGLKITVTHQDTTETERVVTRFLATSSIEQMPAVDSERNAELLRADFTVGVLCM